MKVDRKDLIQILDSVNPGVATRENIDQSSCFVFDRGNVYTFNDEIACCRKIPTHLNLKGAVKAKPLLDLLNKLSEDEIDIDQTDEEFLISGSRRKAGIRMDEQVLLAIDQVESPDQWNELNVDFGQAVKFVSGCASSNLSDFFLTCVHIQPDYIEACDRFQIARYNLKSGLKNEILIRADSLMKIVSFDMTEVSESQTWVHFRNPSGLTISIRKYLGDYTNLDEFLVSEGTEKVVLPGDIRDAVEKAEVFTGDSVLGNVVFVDLRRDKIMIEGQGAFGWYKEMKIVKYDGPPIKFTIAAKLLVEISNKSNECSVGNDKLYVDGENFIYLTSTQPAPQQQEEAVAND